MIYSNLGFATQWKILEEAGHMVANRHYISSLEHYLTRGFGIVTITTRCVWEPPIAKNISDPAIKVSLANAHAIPIVSMLVTLQKSIFCSLQWEQLFIISFIGVYVFFDIPFVIRV